MMKHAVTRWLGKVGRSPGRPTVVTVAAEPDAALLASAAALRRLGARLTRYDADAATTEARMGGDTIRLTVAAADGETSRLEIETDATGARALIRRFRRELARPTPEATR